MVSASAMIIPADVNVATSDAAPSGIERPVAVR
jgi:hypothetical protein